MSTGRFYTRVKPAIQRIGFDLTPIGHLDILMIRFKDYRKVESLEEAWELNQKKRNRIVGGMLWLRLEDLEMNTAIDLSGLGLDRIEEFDDRFEIGAMVSLHQLETDKAFAEYTNGSSIKAVEHIIGIQFRNMATIGGSLYGRYGFSDVLTLLLALDSSVVLYKGGEISLDKFASMPHDNDIITKVIVRKTPARVSYQSVRPQKTDFPTLALCLRYSGDRLYLSCGARPGRAMLLSGAEGENFVVLPDFSEKSIDKVVSLAEEKIPLGANVKGSREYRTRLLKGLIRRALGEIGGAAC